MQTLQWEADDDKTAKEHNYPFVTSWFPPTTRNENGIHPRNFITMKQFVRPILKDDEEEEVKEEQPKKSAEEEGKEVQEFYRSLVLEKTAEITKTDLKEQYYCESCENWIDGNISKEIHENGIPHQFNLHEKPKRSYSLGTDNKGYQLLKLMAWDEDKGLGAQNQGILDPIETQLKNDKKGIGMPVATRKRVTHFRALEVSEKKKKLTKLQKRFLEKRFKEKELRLRRELYQ